MAGRAAKAARVVPAIHVFQFVDKQDVDPSRLWPLARARRGHDDGHHSTNSTAVPFFTMAASARASQLVRRTQPWECTLPTLCGSAVPWMP